MIENGTAISEAGNAPVETNEFIEEGKVSVSGIDVNYKVTESGETKFDIPDEVDQSSPAFIEWEKVASNEMKALAKKYYPNLSWVFVADSPGFIENIYQKEHSYKEKMMPGQTPYSKEELKQLYGLVDDSEKGDQGEAFDKGPKA